MREVYLDSASTTKVRPEVVDAMMPYLTEHYYNPSSLYSDSVKVANTINDSRRIIADFIGANLDEVFFTSGSSESNCTAIEGFVFGWVASHRSQEAFHDGSDFEDLAIMTTTIEHKSIMKCVDNMEDLGCYVDYVNVDENGFVDVDDLTMKLNEYDCCNMLVSIQLANNEIGVIQYINSISKIVHEHGGILHVDATQAFAQIPIDVDDMEIDMLSASAHKIGGPKGTGVLYKRSGINIEPIIYGSQMNGFRGGTENVAGIVGMAKAVELASNEIREKSNLSERRDYFIDKLRSIGCTLNGPAEPRLPNNVSVQLPSGVGGEEMLYMLDLGGIMVSTGSACNSHSKEPSYVLKAIGLSDEESARTIRITISDEITYDIIDKVICEIDKNIKLIKSE